ncbi:hypothetical protein EV188_103471 [Actinomycetospora succinea]|uniref:Cupin domain n=1 Tax=Actinomycetospora succinea TaxID=663603 RepID=A0A4R6VHU2_9PSEU|nr:hypothetical protein [Actinomycetospora succinea]TDQ60967.1 hypothetical protein EV188_103471 [Actinomycetospora succinea]
MSSVMQKAAFDDAAEDRHGGVAKRSVSLDGVTATRVRYDPGARWSIDMAPDAGSPTCPLPHVAVMVEGTLRVRMDDGSEQDFHAGEVMMLPGGHDAWPVGDQPAAFVELSRGTDYYH